MFKEKLLLLLLLLVTFDSHSIPTAQISTITRMATTPTILTSFTPLSMIFSPWDLSKSFNESQNPMVFMEADTEFANAKTIPTEAPNPGPNDLEIMK